MYVDQFSQFIEKEREGSTADGGRARGMGGSGGVGVTDFKTLHP